MTCLLRTEGIFGSTGGGVGPVAITQGTRTLYNPNLDIDPHSISITLDSGADCLFAAVALQDSTANFTAIRQTDGSGTLFTAIGTQVTEGFQKVHCFYLINPTATTIWVDLSANGRLAAVFVPLFGVDPVSPIADFDTAVTAGATTLSTPSLTPVGSGGWLETIFSKAGDTEAATAINHTERHDVDAGPFRLLSGSASEVNAGVAPGWSWGVSRAVAGKAVLFKAAA
jgi:hypothetical protein